MKEGLDALFLQETKLLAKVMAARKFRLGFSICLVVDNKCRSSGIALMWKDDIKLSMFSYSKHHIDALINSSVSTTIEYHITGVYGHLDIAQRMAIWHLIRSMNRRDGLAWLVFGDFNEIQDSNEKCDGSDRSEGQTRDTKNTLNDCDMRDLKYHGVPCTWCNKREGSTCISERLNSFLADLHWC